MMMKSKDFWAVCLAMVLVVAGTAQGLVPVTFQVDMNNVMASSDGVHVAGGFQGWDPAATLLTDDDLDGVYEVTVDLPVNSTHEFKFINGNSWEFVEDVPPTCQVEETVNDNRFIHIPTESTGETYAVCWGSCAACGLTSVRFRVDMVNEEAISPNGVHVAGNFQGWDPGTTALADPDGDGVWETIESFDATEIPDGFLIFKFINGNSWTNPNENLSGFPCSDDYGHRVLEFNSDNMVLSADDDLSQAPCYNSCGACVPPTSVTFRVDMTTQATVSVNGVHVAGSFQGWNPSGNPMSDDNGDGIWEVTMVIEPGDYEFKFVNGNDWGGNGDGNVDNELIVGDCAAAGSDSRALTVGSEAIVYEVCYNSCEFPCMACEFPFDFGASEWGYHPDPSIGESFEDGVFNEPYEDQFHLLVPTNVSEIDPAFTLPLDGMRISEVSVFGSSGESFELSDLGLSLSCDIDDASNGQDCYFPPGNQYCISLLGSPELAGEFLVNLSLEAYATIFGVSVPQPYLIEGIPLNIMSVDCTDPIACNYNPNALEDDGSCEYETCAGCMDESACNYDSGATISDSCYYPEPNQDCDGFCVDPSACNFQGTNTGGVSLYEEGFEGFAPGDYVTDSPIWIPWTAGQEGTDGDAQITNAMAFSGGNSLHIYGASPAGGPMDVVMLVGLTEGTYEASMWMYVADGSSAYYNVQEDLSPGIGWAFEATFAFTGDMQVQSDGAVVGEGSFPLETWFEVSHFIDLDNDVITMNVNGNEVGTWTFDSDFGGINFYGMGDGTTIGDYFIDDIEVSQFNGIAPETCTYPGCQDPAASNYDAAAGCAAECIYLTYDCASIGDEAWSGEDIGLFPDWQQAVHGVAWAGEWVFNVPATIVEPGSSVSYGVHHVEWSSVAGMPGWAVADYALGDLGASSQHCIAASGTPIAPGLHEITATGEVFISIFGQPFSIGTQSYSAWLEIAENPNPIPGCTYANAVNFVGYANDDDGSCLFAGCTDATAGNFNPIATIDDGSCGEACDPSGESTCQSDNNGDGVVNVTDLLTLLGEFGAVCE